MLKNLVNLPFKVLGKAARVVQDRQDAAMKAKHGSGDEGDDFTDMTNVPVDEVPDDFDPGPIVINTAQVQDQIKKGQDVAFVDVRPEPAFAVCHIAGAECFPSKTLSIRLAELPPMGVNIVMYCNDGILSEQVVNLMRFRGLENAWCLDGGLSAWEKAGGETAGNK